MRFASQSSLFIAIIVVVIVLLSVLALEIPIRLTIYESNDLKRAIVYLASNYDSSVGLISETSSGPVFWVYSDNYLAMLALRQVGSSNSTLLAMASNISKTIEGYSQSFGSTPNQYMVLGTPSSARCVINNSTDYAIARFGNVRIRVTLDNGTGQLSESNYADIAFLKAICFQHQGDHGNALREYNQGWSFFNGIGFKDLPFNKTGEYQTYKLALYVYAGKLLSEPVDSTALKALLRMQAPNGGFYSGYNASLSRGTTVTNTETTSLAILALTS